MPELWWRIWCSCRIRKSCRSSFLCDWFPQTSQSSARHRYEFIRILARRKTGRSERVFMILFMYLFQLDCGGLNGRPMKREDVCYSWWVLSALNTLDKSSWIDSEKLKDFILSTQVYNFYAHCLFHIDYNRTTTQVGSQIDLETIQIRFILYLALLLYRLCITKMKSNWNLIWMLKARSWLIFWKSFHSKK